MRNGVQLITYPDSLGGNLKNLKIALDAHFPDAFQGIHILPFYPSSGDRGFAALTYFEVEKSFGDWGDVAVLGEKYDILADIMVNHISRQSEYFQDYLKNGKKSKYSDFFLTLDKIWEDGVPVTSDVEKMFLRRQLPYSKYGEESVWTTFGKEDPSEQVDLDINSEGVRQLFIDIFKHFNEQRINIVRLDAVGYIIKKLGTSCFFVEPEIYEFLDWIAELADSLDIALLPEVHSHYSIQYKLADRGFWIYDFILPYRILEALFDKNGAKLCEYLKSRPHKQFTMLDCHDGIPVKPDLDGLINTAEARRLVDRCLERGANLSLIVSDKHKDADGFDVHQIRGSYYSMLKCDDDAYIAARAIQLFTPGIPQVYYMTLSAGENDYEAVERTGEGREINRRNYSLADIEQAKKKDVVCRQLSLIKFRNEYKVFDGKFEASHLEDTIMLCWEKDAHKAVLEINLSTNESIIKYIKNKKEEMLKL